MSVRTDRKLVRMLKNHGMHNARHIVRESHRVGLPLSSCAALMQAESWGANVFGCDHGTTHGPPWCHQEVTQDRVRALERVSWPNGITNGVGPAQLTSTGFVREADAEGGSWKPGKNMRVGFRLLKQLMKAHGTQNGANAYNGDPSGGYGRRFMTFRDQWQSRINSTLK